MRTINICGLEHEIIECGDNFDTGLHLGQINYDQCRIKINSGITDSLKTATICHEAVHGILTHIGRDDLSNDEQLVSALGNAINTAFTPKVMEVKHE